MGIFSKARDVKDTDIAEMLAKSDDPMKLVRMIISEMEDTLVEARSTAVRALARRKELERTVADLKAQAVDWEQKAELALRKQREDELKRRQEELRELSARVLEAREDEKARIARELHDELGQLLTALKMDLAWVRERTAPGATAAKMEQMVGLLDQTVSATRRISADLRPLMLDDLGLADAATWLVDDFGKRSSIQCRIQVSGAEAIERLPKSAATAIYRAIQESLTNIGRHSGARNAWIMLRDGDGAIEVEVEDDGRGIAPEDLAKSSSLGLKGMRERIAFLGGSLEIARAPRGGTRLRVRVPLQG